jgi:hypothetical protein
MNERQASYMPNATRKMRHTVPPISPVAIRTFVKISRSRFIFPTVRSEAWAGSPTLSCTTTNMGLNIDRASIVPCLHIDVVDASGQSQGGD